VSMVSSLLQDALQLDRAIEDAIVLVYPPKPFRAKAVLALLVSSTPWLPHPFTISEITSPNVLTRMLNAPSLPEAIHVTEGQREALTELGPAFCEVYTCSVQDEIALLKILFNKEIPEILQLQLELQQ